MKTLAILLTVHNRKEKTLNCLKNLYAQTPIEGYQIDVYLTNDGCTDGTPEAVSKLFPEVQIVNGNGDLFWNRGMYTAWERAANSANYDYYLWLNDDTFLYKKAIKKMLHESKISKGKAIICGATCSTRSKQITYGGRNQKGLIQPTGQPEKCSHFNGNIVLVPQYVYRKVGNLDYTYTHALGDFDYGLRAGELGIESYQASCLMGICETHEELPKWCSSKHMFNERREKFYTPTGGHPYEHFYFERKHFGLLRACFHFFTIHLRLTFPQIWEKLK